MPTAAADGSMAVLSCMFIPPFLSQSWQQPRDKSNNIPSQKVKDAMPSLEGGAKVKRSISYSSLLLSLFVSLWLG
jgi:hypothetical protein